MEWCGVQQVSKLNALPEAGLAVGSDMVAQGFVSLGFELHEGQRWYSLCR